MLDYWCVIEFRRRKILSQDWFANCADALEAAGLPE